MSAREKPRIDHDLVLRYDANTPRYTSYPTAAQFTSAVDAATYGRWLTELPAAPVSLYLHVPFCSRLCWYCGCNTRVVNRRDPVDAYVQRLMREIVLVGERLPARLSAAALHLGGGTPNMLSPDALAAVHEALGAAFALVQDLEFAAELDPAGLSAEWVAAAGRLGLNRASLGVQTLSPKVQAAVNRRETYEEVAACIGWLRSAGVRSVNLDLMYGLPFQTSADIEDTLDKVLRLAPERLALFGYAHVPWMKAHQQLIDSSALPGPTERLDQAETAAARLAEAGYVRIGIDHYALPGDTLAQRNADGGVRRNFQGYTTDGADTLLGFGASAIGKLPQGYVQNSAQELGWGAALDQGQLPTARGVVLTAEDRFRGELIERLMCDLSVDLEAVCIRHGRAVGDLDVEIDRLVPFLADGVVRLDAGRVFITPRGRPFVRAVAAVFDACTETRGRHSRTV